MKLLKGYIWMTQWAVRRNRKGRAMGGMIGVRIGIGKGKGKRK